MKCLSKSWPSLKLICVTCSRAVCFSSASASQMWPGLLSCLRFTDCSRTVADEVQLMELNIWIFDSGALLKTDLHCDLFAPPAVKSQTLRVWVRRYSIPLDKHHGERCSSPCYRSNRSVKCTLMCVKYLICNKGLQVIIAIINNLWDWNHKTT